MQIDIGQTVLGASDGLRVESGPGRTVFRARLPVDAHT